MKPTTRDAMKLFMDGAVMLSRMEANGIRVDVGYLKATIAELTASIAQLTAEIHNDKVWTLWRRVYGDRTNIDSAVQLEDILFKRMGHKATQFTATGRAKTGKAVLEDLDVPFIKLLTRLKKLKRVRTRLQSILTESCNGFFHTPWNLHRAVTYRSSASFFQNMDARDEESARYVRRSFIPRKGCVIPEVDYGALEFNIAACKWRDPEMVRYASDESTDPHRDYAMKCFLLKKEQITKPIRNLAKGGFVFAKLYGSYWKNIAKYMWGEMVRTKLKLPDGSLLVDHLHNKGITKCGDAGPGESATPGTFQAHIQKVEAAFEKQFHVMVATAKRWWDDYLERGWFRLMTGFICRGVYSRNELLNFDVQGPGFHCLLWSMIELDRYIIKHKMKSRLSATIHDCVMGDVPEREVQDYLDTTKYLLTEKIRKHWDWIIVPLKAEVDVVPVGKSWLDKVRWEQNQEGIWAAKT